MYKCYPNQVLLSHAQQSMLKPSGE